MNLSWDLLNLYRRIFFSRIEVFRDVMWQHGRQRVKINPAGAWQVTWRIFLSNIMAGDKYSVLLPTYNERDNLPIIIWLLCKYFDER